MNQITIPIIKHTHNFAENKDVAKQLRETLIIPALRDGQQVIVDFGQVSGTTQSFIHALISGPIRKFRSIALDNLIFKNCNTEVQSVIRIVFAYMQESADSSEIN